ncbi:MAG: prepilin-type N-terminal cleavage/methylation domain-containing protein [Planctomycetes bacterium]|nr:prepilin-type N-terminal cleavage/methylation domain-containing protein [Planctomycetota bacterium]
MTFKYRHSNTSNKRSGFTLIEMVVTMAIIGLTITIVYQTLVSVQEGIIETEKVSFPARVGPTILEIMTLDLQNLYVHPDGYKEWDKFFEGDDDGSLNFLTSKNSILRVEGRNSDITEVGYKLEDSDVGSGLQKLIRREDFFLDDDPMKGGKLMVIWDRVVEMQIKYYKKPESLFDLDTMLDDFNAETRWDAREKEGFPAAVRIRILITTANPEYDEDLEDETYHFAYSTVVSLPRYKDMKPDDTQTFEEDAPEPGTPGATTPPADGEQTTPQPGGQQPEGQQPVGQQPGGGR